MIGSPESSVFFVSCRCESELSAAARYKKTRKKTSSKGVLTPIFFLLPLLPGTRRIPLWAKDKEKARVLKPKVKGEKAIEESINRRD
jgi:hypothetical protein